MPGIGGQFRSSLYKNETEIHMEFQDFPKMARLSRKIIITEKIDGTNAQIWIAPGSAATGDDSIDSWFDKSSNTSMVMFAGSRNRWITPENDNYGFAAWVQANAVTLRELGPGRHFGEWWGSGIQRNYGQTGKRFSLFNVSRWENSRPSCCSLVPVLYQGDFTTEAVENSLARLRYLGSEAASGFMKPEGVVVFHTAGNICFKKTIEKDEVPKTLIPLT